MKIAIIGRTEILYNTVKLLCDSGYEIGLILTAKEAPEYEKTSHDFRLLAESLGVPFINSPKIDEQKAYIQSLPPMDIGISVNYTGLISQQIIDLFPLGILNAHAGDLPRYRGNACLAWAILNGEDRIGLCVHRMIGGELDSGDIIAREFFPITLDTKITIAHRWMSERIPAIFLEAVQRLQVDNSYIMEVQSKDPADALRCYPRRPEDGRIDWSLDAINILRLVNACAKPYTGAFCYFENKTIIVWNASLAPNENYLAIPGQVTALSDDYVEVATGKGKLRLCDLEKNGASIKPRQLCSSVRQRFS